MLYKALYRTYRPSTFEDVVGQQHIVLTLANAIKNNKIAHAYLFCGPRGTGKTTVAKLVAKGVNCTGGGHVPCNECDHCISITRGSHPDVVEIDAASNNGVDEIRDLVEKVKYAPLEAKYKVYIIDEVHMLSTGAFNALLKTLEEPPAHVIFILATTEPHKVIPTIISRCQRFDFSKVPPKLIAQRVEYVLQKENIQYEKEVVRLISVLAEGGLRDALTILEQVIAYAKDNLKEEHVHEIYGITTIKEKMELLKAVFSKDANNLLEHLAAIENKSHDIKRLTNDLIDILKEAVIYAYAKNDQILQFLDENEAQSILEYHDASTLLAMVDILIDTYEKYRNATNVLAYFEVSLLKMMNILSPLEVVMDQPIVPAKEIVKEVVPVQAQPTPVAVQEVNTIQKTKAEPQVVANTKIEEAQKDETPAVVEVSVSVAERYPIEVLVQCMVGGQKDKRIEDNEKWKALSDYASDLKWAKEARWLMPSEIIVSGESYIVVIVKSQAAANLINETNHDQDYHEFTNLILGKPKQVIAITNETFKTAYETFKKQHQANRLPKPYHVEIKNTVKKETVVEKAVNLFGEALVEVSEDE
jgi:DNA polymerase-3 subunit gamma/tau